MATRNRWLAVASVAGALLSTMVAGNAFADTKPTPAEQYVLADGYTTRMQVSSTRVRHMLDNARKEKDVVKTVCLSDKLMQIEVSLKSARERLGSMRGAIARGDADVRNHEFSVLGNLRTRADRLEVEANQCIGEPFPIEKDKTKVTVTIDPNIAPIDPSLGSGGGILIVPPTPASGYK
jgi:hypothetical protein